MNSQLRVTKIIIQIKGESIEDTLVVGIEPVGNFLK